MPLALIGMLALGLSPHAGDRDRRPRAARSCSAAGFWSSCWRSTSRPGSSTPTTPRRSARVSPRWSAPVPWRWPRWCAPPRRGGRRRLRARGARRRRHGRRAARADRSRGRSCLVADPAGGAVPARRSSRSRCCADAPAGRSRSRSARCWSRRWPTASVSGSRPSTAPSRRPAPTTTRATAASTSRRPMCEADRGLLCLLREHGATAPLPAADPVLRPGGAADPARPASLGRGRLRRERPCAQQLAARRTRGRPAGPLPADQRPLFRPRRQQRRRPRRASSAPRCPQVIVGAGTPIDLEGGPSSSIAPAAPRTLRHPYATARAFLRAHPNVHYTL